MEKIFINQVLAEVNKPNAVFELAFRKDNGEISIKKKVFNRASNLNDRKVFNRSGLLKCFNKETGEKFDCTIDCIVRFNGMKIIRPTQNGNS
jgi:hypothetical protein